MLSLRAMLKFYSRYQPIIAFLCALFVLLIVYLPTLQTTINGSDHYYMADVGETQVVLNVWGTLHITGYPLYVMLSAALVSILKLFGVPAIVAPSLTSLLWGIIAFALLYTLMYHVTGRVWLSALALVLFGLMRTIWIHNVIPEVYSFGEIILILLLLIALWREPIRHRIYWLAFIGGIGVFNHRALGMVAPALLFAVWGELVAQPRKIPRILIICLLLGLLGFLPYAYLPLRAWSGASWVYGDPGTFQGFLDQFFAREADRFIGMRNSWDALLDNFTVVNNVLFTDATIFGVIVGVVGLLLGVSVQRTRQAAIVMILNGVVAYGFHVLFYVDILSALIIPVLVSLAFGWLFAADWLLNLVVTRAQYITPLRVVRYAAIAVAAIAFAVVIFAQNQPFIVELTTNPRGRETVNLMRVVPENSTLMIGWGMDHSAAGFAQEMWGLLPNVTLIDHNGDLTAPAQNGTLVTPDFSFYAFPLSWWEGRIGQRVYLDVVRPHLVGVSTTPTISDTISGEEGVIAIEQEAECFSWGLDIRVTWQAQSTPTRDLSVFVHLLDADGNVIAQGDESAPVYGWYPLTLWQAGEVVRDRYMLPLMSGAAQIRFGMYHQESDGSFVNDTEYEVDLPMCYD